VKCGDGGVDRDKGLEGEGRKRSRRKPEVGSYVKAQQKLGTDEVREDRARGRIWEVGVRR
jgi:hypothetical protein